MGANYTSSSYCTEESSTNSVTNMFTLKMYPALGTLNIHNFMHCIIHCVKVLLISPVL